MNPLGSYDFPLTSVGANVYRRTESSPLLVAPSDAVAADICARLNRDHFGRAEITVVPNAFPPELIARSDTAKLFIATPLA